MASPSALDGTAAPTRVVVVDDNEDIRFVLRLALEREPDFELVAEASDGQQGVLAVTAHKPHVVLLDVAMPVMDGLQAVSLIRAESPGTIIVMLSAVTAPSAAQQALALGAHAYIEKGGGVPELMTQLRAALAERFRTVDPG